MNNYQDVILSVTKEFHQLKMDHLASEVESSNSSDDFAPSSQMKSTSEWRGRGNQRRNNESKSSYFNNKNSNLGLKGKSAEGGKRKKGSSSRGNSPKRRS